jgi:hypothetical protein
MMPHVVTRAIDSILSGKIQSSGGFETDPMTIVNTTSYAPKHKVCEQ